MGFQVRAGIVAKEIETGKKVFVIGESTSQGVWAIQRYSDYGSFNLALVADADLSEWVEPKVLRGWVAICARGKSLSDVMDSKASAIRNFRANFGYAPTFTAEINCLEGEGLGGEK